MKYDCPVCRCGCVVGVPQTVALIKGAWGWRRRDGMKGLEGVNGDMRI